MKKIIIISVLILFSLKLKAQDNKKTLWETLKGKELESSVSFLPVGAHYTALDFVGVWYASINYKSIEFARFTNSFDDLTLAVLYKREIEITENFSIMYSFGIMYGYDGRLKKVEAIPFRKTFLFTGDIKFWFPENLTIFC